MLRGGIVAIGGCVIALAVVASPALATTDRLDYADQANPICKSANQQYEQLYESAEAEIDRLYDLNPKSRKKARRIYDRIETLENQLPSLILGIYQAELGQLKSIAAPPGYESTVATWLATRQEILTLYQQYLQIEELEDNGFALHKKPSRKAIKRLHKRYQALERRLDQTIQQLLTDSEIDLELGTRMGAAYCVTGATGQLPESVGFVGD
jgi:hypothetical protein